MGNEIFQSSVDFGFGITALKREALAINIRVCGIDCISQPFHGRLFIRGGFILLVTNNILY